MIQVRRCISPTLGGRRKTTTLVMRSVFMMGHSHLLSGNGGDSNSSLSRGVLVKRDELDGTGLTLRDGTSLL